MRPERWLIAADDLTGAADCGVAFAERGVASSVSWGAVEMADPVIAIDVNSRALSARDAGARHARVLARHYRPGTALFKKIDSTLRGRPVEELVETIRVLRSLGHRALAVVAPAFPATGRTMERGAVRVHGEPLEATALWARDHSYPHAGLADLLRGAGLRAGLFDADLFAGEPDRLARLMQGMIDHGWDAVVCDATQAEHLDSLAAATLPLVDHVFWVGSGGLAQSLAEAAAPWLAPSSSASLALPAMRGGILFVVGTLAEASRAAATVLAADPLVLPVSIAPSALLAGPHHPACRRLTDEVAEALGRGDDVLVRIAAEDTADLSQGALMAARLAALLRPAALQPGAIVATGGDTAMALLEALGIVGIRLLTTIEPGVPVGVSLGALTVPVITKAGAFGDAGTLSRCLSYLRRLRPMETPS